MNNEHNPLYLGLRAELVQICLKEALRADFAHSITRPALTNEQRAAFCVNQADAIIREMKKV